MIILFNKSFKETTQIIDCVVTLQGIGYAMAKQALDQLGISKSVQLGKIKRQKLSELRNLLYQNYVVENDLRSLVRRNKSRLQTISCYRSLRHQRFLPCRGQRTHTNASTCRRLKK